MNAKAATETGDDRITALEETVAHQARAIEELSGEIAEQWKVIRVLRKQVGTLTERLLAVEENGPAEARRPPHW